MLVSKYTVRGLLMKKAEFENLMEKYPARKFCLHNGFAGFHFGCPSNPEWISFEEAYDLLLKYENLTGINPISDFENTWYINALLFDNDEANQLREETGFRMLGFNEEKDCIYE